MSLKSAFPPSPFEVLIFSDQFAKKKYNLHENVVTFDRL